MNIERIVNSPVSSNTYVLYDFLYGRSCIIVDPGEADSKAVLEFCEHSGLFPEYILLTHEHFDHIWGCNTLKTIYPEIKIVCSKACAKGIAHPQNYFNLLYFNDGSYFAVREVDLIVEDIGYRLPWNNRSISFIETPGHTQGSICFLIDHYLFTGDTLMKEHKAIVKKRDGGSVESLRQSILLIEQLFAANNVHVCPGHGSEFLLSTLHFNNNDIL